MLMEKAFNDHCATEFSEENLSVGCYEIPKKELAWARLQDRIRNRRKAPRLTALKKCAAVVLVFASVAAAVLASSVEVRAAVGEFFSSWFSRIADIFYTEAPHEAEETDLYLYDVTYVPKGFELVEKAEGELLRRYVYTNMGKDLIIEIARTDKATVKLDSDTSLYEEVWLGKNSAYFIKEKDGENSAVIFGDKNITVYAGGELERDELINVASGINTNEATILGYVRRFSGHTADLPNVAAYEYTSAIRDFDYASQAALDAPVKMGIRLPYSWRHAGLNSCESVDPEGFYTHIASSSAGVLFKVDSDFVLDCRFHETQRNRFAFSLSTFEGKKVSQYRTAGGFDSVIYYQYDDADNIFLHAFIRISDEYIMSINLSDDSKNAAIMLDILDSIKYGEYDSAEEETYTAMRHNFDLLTDREKQLYMMLEKGEITDGTIFYGEDAEAIRIATKLYRLNNEAESWRNGSRIYYVEIPDYGKSEAILHFDTVDASEAGWYNSASEGSYLLAKNYIVKLAGEKKTDVEKLRFIADIFCKNANLTDTGYSEIIPYTNLSVTALDTMRGNCCGFAYAFEAICNASGIEAITVYASDSEGHFLTNNFAPHEHYWNMVRLNGEWYHIDLSRMMTNRSDADPFDLYFLISDDDATKINGGYSRMLYGDDIASNAFTLPRAAASYRKES